MCSGQNNQLSCWASQKPAYSRVLNPGAGRIITSQERATLALRVPLPSRRGQGEAVDCVQDCGGVGFRAIKVIFFFKQRIKKNHCTKRKAVYSCLVTRPNWHMNFLVQNEGTYTGKCSAISTIVCRPLFSAERGLETRRPTLTQGGHGLKDWEGESERVSPGDPAL